jgi:nucleotide-binding universal stress UspA family protein
MAERFSGLVALMQAVPRGDGFLSSRILVAVSTPWASEKLAGTIRDLATRLAASVVVAHVARPTEQDETADDTRLRGEQALAGITTKLVEANIPAEGLLLYGDDVARAILNAAEAQHATLIVMGLTGKSTIARLLAGDVPSAVTKATTIPVLLMPPDWSGKI